VELAYPFPKMNVIQAIQDYITKMVSSAPGMKCLLLDKETAGIVSMVFSQSQIIQKEVCLFERIDASNRETMLHLKAIAFLRPTADNLRNLQAELKDPKYGEYHLFFSNTVKNSYLEELAEADIHEVIQQVHEYFADFFAINVDTLTLNLDGLVSTTQSDFRPLLGRAVDGLTACILSLRRQPSVRVSGKSQMVQKVFAELQARVNQDPSLFDFKKTDTPPLLLILDRVDDPVTPLLTQWTYQAMVHEVFGISNNRVNLKKHTAVKKELEEVILSPDQDSWFKQTMYMNFGDLGVKIKELVDDYQQKSQSNQKIETIEDIKRFVEQFPEFKKMAGNVFKHVTLVSELSKAVEDRALLEVSELEQELANNHSHNEHLDMLRSHFRNPKTKPHDLLKLTMLYALRYETSTNDLPNLMKELEAANVEKSKVELITLLLNYAGASKRGGDLFGTKSIFKRGIKSLQRGLKGVQNIYTEHKPLLKSVLDQVLVNKLRTDEYPYVQGNPTRDAPQDIIIFIVGGITYEESFTVHQFNVSNPNVRMVLGGTSVHNSSSFLKDVASLRDLDYR